MSELQTYRFPARPAAGLLFGLSLSRLLTIGAAGCVLIVVTSRPTLGSVTLGGLLIIMLLVAASVKVAGRPAVDWMPVWVGYGWAMASRNNEFYASPDLTTGELPEGMLDLPGELFGFELHTYQADTQASFANPTPAGYGVLVDTFRHRMVAVVEVSGQDTLFLDPGDQQVRFTGWGGLLDHLAQSLPELARLQVVHLVGPASVGSLARWHETHGGRGTEVTAASYRQVLEAAGGGAQDHRLVVAVALDRRAARRAVRQAGGGRDGAAAVLLDRAAMLEEALIGVGLQVHGWLPARAIAQLLRVGFDPAARRELDTRPVDVHDGGGVDPRVAGPVGLVDQWSALRHASGWSTTLQVTGPPSRPVTGEFLQHLLIGVPAERRMSLLYVPTPMSVAERRAQTQQIAAESEQALRSRWGFSTSARHRREHGDAARREEELVEGRAVYRLVWTITVTAPDTAGLDVAVGQLETAARRCGVELRRLVGTQRQAASFSLPLCRGAR